MRTQREAKLPSNRIGMFPYQPDRHYVIAQRPGPDWEYDSVSDLLYTFDPATGKSAYRVDVDGSEGDGARFTGKRNAVLLSCSKAYFDTKQREEVRRSKAMKNADFTLGQFAGGAEYKPDSMPETPINLGEAVEQMQAISQQRGYESDTYGSPELANV